MAQIRKSKKRGKGKEKVGIDEFSPFVLRPQLSSSIDRMWEGGRATEQDRLTLTCRLAYLKPFLMEYRSRSAGSQRLPSSFCVPAIASDYRTLTQHPIVGPLRLPDCHTTCVCLCGHMYVESGKPCYQACGMAATAAHQASSHSKCRAIERHDSFLPPPPPCRPPLDPSRAAEISLLRLGCKVPLCWHAGCVFGAVPTERLQYRRA